MSKNDIRITKARKKFIKESEEYLTPFEQFSHKILSIMYKSIFWVLLPFVVLIFLVDGFNIPVLTVLGTDFLIFVPMIRLNEKRLEFLIEARMEMDKKMVSDKRIESQSEMELSTSDEGGSSFGFPAISINMGSNSFFVTAISFFITFLFVWSHGWGDSLTKFFLYLSLALLIFSFWFPYSNLIKRQIEVYGEFLKVGKRTLFYREIREVVCRGNGSAIEFHLTYTGEPIKIRPENDFQEEAKEAMREWCQHLDIPFIVLPK